jgi:hypothetical protein
MSAPVPVPPYDFQHPLKPPGPVRPAPNITSARRALERDIESGAYDPGGFYVRLAPAARKVVKK